MNSAKHQAANQDPNAGLVNLQQLQAEKQRKSQEGYVSLDLLKNTVFSSILPLEVDLLSAYCGNVDKALGFIQTVPGLIFSSFSKKKPPSFLLSFFEAVDVVKMFENFSNPNQQPDKYGSDYQEYQQALQKHKPVDYEGQQKYEQSRQEQSRGHQNDHAPDEIAKFSEGHRRMQQQNYENHNHNNHYNALESWKKNSQIFEEIKRKHEMHNHALQKSLRDSNEAYQKQQRIDQAKRRR